MSFQDMWFTFLEYKVIYCINESSNVATGSVFIKKNDGCVKVVLDPWKSPAF